MKCYLFEHDPMDVHLYTDTEWSDLFGSDFEYAREIPDAVAKEYLRLRMRWKALQTKLRALLTEQRRS